MMKMVMRTVDRKLFAVRNQISLLGQGLPQFLALQAPQTLLNGCDKRFVLMGQT